MVGRRTLTRLLPEACHSRRSSHDWWVFLLYFLITSPSLFCTLTLLPHLPRPCSVKEPGLQAAQDGYFETLVCCLLCQQAFRIKSCSKSCSSRQQTPHLPDSLACCACLDYSVTMVTMVTGWCPGEKVASKVLYNPHLSVCYRFVDWILSGGARNGSTNTVQEQPLSTNPHTGDFPCEIQASPTGLAP